MTADSPVLIDVPMPIHTPRLMIRPRKPGDGEFALAAIRETWDEIHRWMWWAENLDQFTSEQLEMRNRRAIASFIQRDGIELLGIETTTGEPLCGAGFTISTGKPASATPASGFVEAPKAGILQRSRRTRCSATLLVR